MKTILLSLLLCGSLAVFAAEYVTLRQPLDSADSPVLEVSTNRTAKLIYYWQDNGSLLRLIFPESGLFSISSREILVNPPLMLKGPAKFQIQGGGASPGRVGAFATFEVITDTPTAGLVTPSTAVVIPEDAAGPVQIILESSADLVTWTSANPGLYGASTSKRFFRVRAQRQ